jgi:hypothetical protein
MKAKRIASVTSDGTEWRYQMVKGSVRLGSGFAQAKTSCIR